MSSRPRLPAPLASRRAAVWLALVVVVTAGLTRSGLLGVLGFELALVMAGLGSLAGVDLGAAWIRRRRDRPDPPGPLRAVAEAVAAPLAIMLVPLAMVSVRGLWTRTCDPWFGAWAYVALTLASTAMTAAAAAGLAVVVGPRRWLGRLAPYLALVLVIIAGVHRFFTQPPVFTYNPLVGYFPGNLYDEDIRLGAPLGWARLEQLAVVIALWAAVAARYDRARLAVRWRGHAVAWRPAVVAVVALAAAGWLRHDAGRLGYAIDAADIARALGGEVRTAHFVIHYATTPEIVADIDLIAADHELRLAQVCRQIGVAPEAVGTIHSFYFASTDDKARLMGARHVEMAKPWLRQIYLTHDEFPHSSLRHEIAHVVAGTFGSPWFRVSARSVAGVPVLVNPGLIEGLAVALDWPGARSMTPHQAMRAMELLGFAPSPADVFSVRFMTLSSARGYTAAGSFLRFLLDTYGPAPVREVYRSGGDFPAAFGKSQATLVAEWRAMLATIEVPPAELEVARERFRQGGVFDRPCPHATAKRVAAAGEHAAAGDRAGAIAILRGICEDTPEEPTYALGLASLLAAGDATEVAEARTIYQRWADAAVSAPVRAVALDALAHQAGRAGDDAAALAQVDAALALPLGDDRARQFEALRIGLVSARPDAAFVHGYFFSTVDGGLAWAAMAVLADPTDPLARYLLALQCAQQRWWALSAYLLDRALAADLPSARFVRNAARRLAVIAWRAGDRAALGRAIATLDTTGDVVDRALAADWRERAAR